MQALVGDVGAGRRAEPAIDRVSELAVPDRRPRTASQATKARRCGTCRRLPRPPSRAENA